jgi:hypothetical protein
MTNYTLTLELNLEQLQYLTKFHSLLAKADAYENGIEIRDNITTQLDSLKNSPLLTGYETNYVGEAHYR